MDLNRKLRILVFTDTLIVVKNKKSLGNEKCIREYSLLLFHPAASYPLIGTLL